MTSASIHETFPARRPLKPVGKGAAAV